MKILIIIVIVIICSFITAYKVDNTKKHTIAIRQCVMMIDNIEIMLKYNNITIERIVDNLILSNNYYLLSFLNEIQTALISREFNEISLCNNCTGLFDAEDITFINGFISNLGKSDTQGQLSNCKLYKEFFKTKLSRLEKEENAICKSQTVIIMGVGFAISIILV